MNTFDYPSFNTIKLCNMRKWFNSTLSNPACSHIEHNIRYQIALIHEELIIRGLTSFIPGLKQFLSLTR